MSASRLSLALEGGGPGLPEAGPIGVFGARAETDLDALPRDRIEVIQTLRPDVDALEARGFRCVTAPRGDYAASVVVLPRAKALGRAMVAEAVRHTPGGTIIVDGQKTDGVESMLRDLRRRVDVSAPVSKAHGKAFGFTASGGFDDWRAEAPRRIEGGFVTAPGVFSADGIDPASALLADGLPAQLGRHVVDLGAGWGYLAARLLERAGIDRLDLVEADHAALDCARINVTDPRARFHWADARVWTPEAAADCVVTNPPFHAGRAADPDLGRAFLAAAARILAPGGQLWLVANRHLPYEAALRALFASVDEAGGDARFKILNARRPVRRRG